MWPWAGNLIKTVILQLFRSVCRHTASLMKNGTWQTDGRGHVPDIFHHWWKFLCCIFLNSTELCFVDWKQCLTSSVWVVGLPWRADGIVFLFAKSYLFISIDNIGTKTKSPQSLNMSEYICHINSSINTKNNCAFLAHMYISHWTQIAVHFIYFLTL